MEDKSELFNKNDFVKIFFHTLIGLSLIFITANASMALSRLQGASRAQGEFIFFPVYILGFVLAAINSRIDKSTPFIKEISKYNFIFVILIMPLGLFGEDAFRNSFISGIVYYFITFALFFSPLIPLLKKLKSKNKSRLTNLEKIEKSSWLEKILYILTSLTIFFWFIDLFKFIPSRIVSFDFLMYVFWFILASFFIIRLFIQKGFFCLNLIFAIWWCALTLYNFSLILIIKLDSMLNLALSFILTLIFLLLWSKDNKKDIKIF